MVRRRKGMLLPEDLDLDALRATPGGGRPQPAFHERAAPAAPAATPAMPEGDERPLKEKAVATTLYLLPADHKRLKKLAVDRDVSLQTVVLDALDLLLAGEGQASVERWDTRRKVR
ncbi:MAG: hypothetical protein M3Y22_11795 [Pseudomonadota bacterium]|nr:hypothetical protein [Pseudomonadota bacterium]